MLRTACLIVCVLFPCMLFPCIAFAQGTEISATDFVTGVSGVIAAFQKNWMLGLSALFSFIGTTVIRVPTIASFLDKIEDWIRPLIGVIAAFGVGYLGALSMDNNYYEAFTPGFLAAVVGGWWHKLVVAIRTEPEDNKTV